METVQQELQRPNAEDGNGKWPTRRYYIWSLFSYLGGFNYYGEGHRVLWDILFEEMTLPQITY